MAGRFCRAQGQRLPIRRLQRRIRSEKPADLGRPDEPAEGNDRRRGNRGNPVDTAHRQSEGLVPVARRPGVAPRLCTARVRSIRALQGIVRAATGGRAYGRQRVPRGPLATGDGVRRRPSVDDGTDRRRIPARAQNLADGTVRFVHGGGGQDREEGEIEPEDDDVLPSWRPPARRYPGPLSAYRPRTRFRHHRSGTPAVSVCAGCGPRDPLGGVRGRVVDGRGRLDGRRSSGVAGQVPGHASGVAGVDARGLRARRFGRWLAYLGRCRVVGRPRHARQAPGGIESGTMGDDRRAESGGGGDGTQEYTLPGKPMSVFVRFLREPRALAGRDDAPWNPRRKYGAGGGIRVRSPDSRRRQTLRVRIAFLHALSDG